MKRRKSGKKKELTVLAEHLHVEVRFLDEAVQDGALIPEDLPANPRAASPAQLARLRRLQRLCRGLELDVYAGAIIVDLLERMDEMRRELDRLRVAGF